MRVYLYAREDCKVALLERHCAASQRSYSFDCRLSFLYIAGFRQRILIRRLWRLTRHDTPLFYPSLCKEFLTWCVFDQQFELFGDCKHMALSKLWTTNTMKSRRECKWKGMAGSTQTSLYTSKTSKMYTSKSSRDKSTTYTCVHVERFLIFFFVSRIFIQTNLIQGELGCRQEGRKEQRGYTKQWVLKWNHALTILSARWFLLRGRFHRDWSGCKLLWLDANFFIQNNGFMFSCRNEIGYSVRESITGW